MWACVKTSNCGHLVLTSHYIVDAYGFSSPNREFFCLGSWSTCGCLITWTSEHTWTTNATSPSLHPHRVNLHVEITGKAHTYRKSGFPSPPRLPPKQKKKQQHMTQPRHFTTKPPAPRPLERWSLDSCTALSNSKGSAWVDPQGTWQRCKGTELMWQILLS
jgi:hypothetical protein